ncbi:MAG: type II toxin-antitoxin system HicB family antitoxin [Candidatus Daviesbacteria bacterium]|nr:type II toxin-antitoxin system HicB family antitoxin [Candidatus Daviesbacteria bacterium]
MKQNIANYTVVIEKEKRTGTDKICYTAFVPFLGIAVEADSIEKAEQEIQSLIQFHIESLAEEKVEIPVEQNNNFVTKSTVNLPFNAIIANA